MFWFLAVILMLISIVLTYRNARKWGVRLADCSTFGLSIFLLPLFIIAPYIVYGITCHT